MLFVFLLPLMLVNKDYHNCLCVRCHFKTEILTLLFLQKFNLVHDTERGAKILDNQKSPWDCYETDRTSLLSTAFLCTVSVNPCLPINPAFVTNGHRDALCGPVRRLASSQLLCLRDHPEGTGAVVETESNATRRSVRDTDGIVIYRRRSPQPDLLFNVTRSTYLCTSHLRRRRIGCKTTSKWCHWGKNWPEQINK